MANIRLMQLNCHKSKAVMANLANSLMTDYHIGLLQEPHAYNKNIAGLNQYHVLYDHTKHARTAIIAQPNTNIWFEGKYSDKDVTTAILQTTDKPMYLTSAYLDIQNNGQKMFPTKLIELIKLCKRENHPLIVSMDANAHSTLYGHETNARGETLEEFVLEHNLQIENIGSCLLYTSPSPRDRQKSRMPSSA